MKFSIDLEDDSDNSHPAEAEVEVCGGVVVIVLPPPMRRIAFKITSFKLGVEALEKDAAG